VAKGHDCATFADIKIVARDVYQIHISRSFPVAFTLGRGKVDVAYVSQDKIAKGERGLFCKFTAQGIRRFFAWFDAATEQTNSAASLGIILCAAIKYKAAIRQA